MTGVHPNKDRCIIYNMCTDVSITINNRIQGVCYTHCIMFQTYKCKLTINIKLSVGPDIMQNLLTAVKPTLKYPENSAK